MQESGLTEIIPLICTSAIWGQYPVFSHPGFPQGSLAPLGVLQSLMTVTSFDYGHSTAFFSCVLMGFQTHPKVIHLN